MSLLVQTLNDLKLKNNYPIARDDIQFWVKDTSANNQKSKIGKIETENP